MSLILVNQDPNTVPTPASGKTSVFTTVDNQLAIKIPSGGVSTYPSINPDTGNMDIGSANFVTTGNVTGGTFYGNFQGNIVGNLVIPGPDTGIAFNDGGDANSNINFTYQKTNSYVYLNGNANFTGNTTLNNLTVTGTLSANDISVTSIQDGNSNVAIAPNGYVTMSVTGVSNVVTVTPTGANISGYANVTGNFNAAGNVNFAASPNVELGSVSNVHITGGTAGYVLTTDGMGNLSWSGSPTDVYEIQHGYSNVIIPTANGNVYINTNAAIDFGWVFDTNGNTTFPSTGTTDLGNVAKAQYAYIGNNANVSEYVNATAIFSSVNFNYTAPDNIGLVAEAKANLTNTSVTGIGILGIGQTAANTKGTGIQGEGHVTNSTDTGAAVGVRAYATDTHMGGYNIGVLANASGSGLNNYALYVQNGGIGSIENPTFWDLYDNSNNAITFGSSMQSNIFVIDTTDNATGVSVTGYVKANGNATVGGIKTDNYYYANGVPVDFVKAAGYTNDVQYNVGGDLGASGNFTYDPTGSGNLSLNSGSLSANAVNLTGNANVGGTLRVTGDVSANNANINNDVNVFNGNINVSAGNVSAPNVNAQTLNTGILVANSDAYIANALFVGANANIIETNYPSSVILANGNASGYLALSLVNQNPNASSDLVGYADNGNADAGWVDVGFTGSNYADPNFTITKPNDGYLFTAAVPGYGGNLVLATAGTGTTNDIVFATSFDVTGEVMRFSNAQQQFQIEPSTLSTTSTTGALVVTGGVGVGGDINVGGNANFTGNTSAVNANYTGNLKAVDANFTGNLTAANANVTGNFTLAGNANVGNINACVANFTGNLYATNANFSGQLYAGANANLRGNVSVGYNIFANGNISSNGNISTEGLLFVGPNAANTGYVNPTLIATANGATYVQAALVNQNDQGSADWIAYGDNSNTDAGWADMGYTGSMFSDANYTITGPNDGYFFVDAASGYGGNLVLATGPNSAVGDIIFAVGGFHNTNEVMRFSNSKLQFAVETTTPATSTTTGALIVSGGVGIAGDEYVGGNTNVTGNVVAANLYANSGTIKSTSAVVSANVTAGNVYANSGTIGASLLTGTLTTAAQPNVTSLGTLTGANVNGNIVAANITANTGVFTGNGSGLNNVRGANVTGQVSNALVAGTVYTNAQPNITSVGTLQGLVVHGNITPDTDITYSLGNATNRFSNLYLSGNTINLGGASMSANGSAIAMTNPAGGTFSVVGTGDSNTAAIVNGNSNVYVTPNSNIALSVNGNANIVVVTGVGANVNGTLDVSGNANVQLLALDANGNANVKGTLLAGGNLTVPNANLGNLAIANFANVSGNVVAGNVYANSGTIKASSLIGEAGNLSNITGGNVTGQVANALVAGTVYTNAQPNITSVGTLTSLNVTGNANSGTVNTGDVYSTTGNIRTTASTGNLFNFTATTVNIGGNAISAVNIGNSTGVVNLNSNTTVTGTLTATHLSGEAGNISNVQGGNISGQVGNALVAGTVYTAAQPNITSVGTLSSLAVTGNITSGNANLGNLATANFFSGNGASITGLPLANLSTVLLSSPTSGQVLEYNGTNWINATISIPTSAGSGVGFWFTTPAVVAYNSSNNFFQLDTLNGSPNTSSQTYANATINGTAPIVGVVSIGLGRTQFDAGNYDFSIWANANSISGTANIQPATYFVNPGSGTITVTGTGTSRTATASSDAPFANSVASADPTVSSWLQTPEGLYQITAKTSSTVVTIATPSTYVNDSAASYSVWDQYFTIPAQALVSTTISEYIFSSTAAAASVSTTTELGILVIGTSGANKTFYVTINGTTSISHVSTPFVTLHDSLAGLQGGTSNEYFHMTSAEYTGTGSGNFVRASSPVLTTPNIGAATGTSLNVSGNVSGADYISSSGNIRTSAGTGNLFNFTATTVNIGGNASIAVNIGNSTGAINLNTNTVVTGNITSTNANLGNAVNANYFIGSGNNLSNIQGANVSGQVSNALVAGTVYTAAQPNITSLGTLSSLTVTGNTTVGNLIGPHANGNSNVNIPSANGNVNISAVGNANVLVVTGTGANITGTANVSGNANVGNIGAAAGVFTGNVSAGNANVTGQLISTVATGTAPLVVTSTTQVANLNVATAGTAGTVTTAAQPNITSVGTLTSLTVTGNITSGNANLGNAATANYFFGAGNNLSNIQAANVSGQVSNALVAGTVYTNAQPNITSVGTLTSLTVSGSITGSISGSAATVTTAAQPNITSVGTLTSLTVSGTTTSGNFTTAGTITSSNSPAANASALALTGTVQTAASNTGLLQVGNALNYIDTNLIQTWVGNANSYLEVIMQNQSPNSNASTDFIVSNDINSNTGYGDFGVNGSNFSGAGPFSDANGVYLYSAGGNLSVGTFNANIYKIATNNATRMTVDANGNIGIANTAPTSNLSVTGNFYVSANANVGNIGAAAGVFTGNISSGNANLGNLTTSNYFAGTLTTAAQPNITSVGTLSSLGVSGAVTASTLVSNVATGTAPFTVTSTTQVANLNVATAGTAGTVTTAAQPNITSVGTLTSLAVTGNVTAGNLVAPLANGNSNVNIPAANGNVNISAVGAANILVVTGTGVNVAGTLNSTGALNSATHTLTANSNIAMSGTLSQISGGNLVSASYLTGTLTTAAQPNITSVGTLSSLAVTGNVTAGNANVTGQLISTVATGTAPLVVSSTTTVANLSATTATTAGTVTTAAQPNITSVGTLSSLGVSGAVTASTLVSNVATGTAPLTVSSTTQVANLNAATAGTVITAAQPNITSVSTSFTSLTFANAQTITANNVTFSTGANTNAGTFTGNFSLSAGSKLNATYADLAELYSADAKYEPGTVLMFGGNAEVTIASDFDSTAVAGVVSTNPAYMMNAGCPGEFTAELALQGRVPTKVCGTVRKGDLMVSAPNGYAVANNLARAGTIIGKALQNFDGETGTIEVVVGRF